MAIAIAAAALAGSMPSTFSISARPTASSPSSHNGNTAVQPGTGQTAAARRMFTAGNGSGWWAGYRRRPARTVAQDKRDARRTRNRRRSK